MHIKAMYDTDGVTTVRWPNSFCKVTHTVDGKVTELWIKVDSPLKGWRGHEVASLIVH